MGNLQLQNREEKRFGPMQRALTLLTLLILIGNLILRGVDRYKNPTFLYFLYMDRLGPDGPLYVFFKGFTFPTLLPSRAPCKISKSTPGPDYIIRNRLLVLSGKRIPDQMLCAFLCLFLM